MLSVDNGRQHGLAFARVVRRLGVVTGLAQYLLFASGRAVRLKPGRLYSIGRDRAATIRIADESLSRLHVQLAGDGHGGWAVTDLESRNGTYVGGTRLIAQQATRLTDGDRVRFGGQLCEYRSLPMGADADALAGALRDEARVTLDGEPPEASVRTLTGIVPEQGLFPLLHYCWLHSVSGVLRLAGDAQQCLVLHAGAVVGARAPGADTGVTAVRQLHEARGATFALVDGGLAADAPVLPVVCGAEELLRSLAQGPTSLLVGQDLWGAQAAQRTQARQLRLCPGPGVNVAVLAAPLDAVGGDFYEAMPLAGGATLLAIGDVSGHGVPAALLVAQIVQSLRGVAKQAREVGALWTALHADLADAWADGTFATVALAVCDGATLTTVHAGHPAWVVRRADGTVQRADGGGRVPPLGLRHGSSAPVTTLTWGPGDAVVGYTDGLTECRPLGQAGADDFGEERLLAAVATATGTAAERAAAITAAASAFGTFSDDRTVLVALCDAETTRP
jgi:hypothetical protein